MAYRAYKLTGYKLTGLNISFKDVGETAPCDVSLVSFKKREI